MDKHIKPALGVEPWWFTQCKRIEKLNGAIDRYIRHIQEYIHHENHVENYKSIAKWAKEIELLALLLAEMEKGAPR